MDRLTALLVSIPQVSRALGQELADCRNELAEDADPQYLELVNSRYLAVHLTWYGHGTAGEVDNLEWCGCDDRDDALAGMTEFVFAWSREDYWHQGLLFDLDSGKRVPYRMVQRLELEEDE